MSNTEARLVRVQAAYSNPDIYSVIDSKRRSPAVRAKILTRANILVPTLSLGRPPEKVQVITEYAIDAGRQIEQQVREAEKENPVVILKGRLDIAARPLMERLKVEQVSVADRRIIEASRKLASDLGELEEKLSTRINLNLFDQRMDGGQGNFEEAVVGAIPDGVIKNIEVDGENYYREDDPMRATYDGYPHDGFQDFADSMVRVLGVDTPPMADLKKSRHWGNLGNDCKYSITGIKALKTGIAGVTASITNNEKDNYTGYPDKLRLFLQLDANALRRMAGPKPVEPSPSNPK